jgi:hypothetical protein
VLAGEWTWSSGTRGLGLERNPARWSCPVDHDLEDAGALLSFAWRGAEQAVGWVYETHESCAS